MALGLPEPTPAQLRGIARIAIGGRPVPMTTTEFMAQVYAFEAHRRAASWGWIEALCWRMPYRAIELADWDATLTGQSTPVANGPVGRGGR